MDSHTTTLQHPMLRSLLAQAQANEAAIQVLFADWTDRQLVWKPDARSWNAVECVDHLLKAGDLYYPAIRAALGRADAGAGAHRPTIMGRMFYAFVRPGGWKVPTVAPFEPTTHTLEDTSVADRFVEQQQTLYALLRDADGQDLNSGRFASPVSSLVRFNLGDGLRIMTAHQQRHIQQAQRLRERDSFPA